MGEGDVLALLVHGGGGAAECVALQQAGLPHHYGDRPAAQHGAAFQPATTSTDDIHISTAAVHNKYGTVE